MAKIQVVILPDGKVKAFVDKSQAIDYEAARNMLARMLGTLETEGIEFDDIGQIEQHTHPQDVTVRAAVSNG
jgi:hypothetical protein